MSSILLEIFLWEMIFHKVSLWEMLNRDREDAVLLKRQWDFSEFLELSDHIDSPQTSILSFLFIWKKTLTFREQVMTYLGTLAIICRAKQNNGTIMVTYNTKPNHDCQFHLNSYKSWSIHVWYPKRFSMSDVSYAYTLTSFSSYHKTIYSLHKIYRIHSRAEKKNN